MKSHFFTDSTSVRCLACIKGHNKEIDGQSENKGLRKAVAMDSEHIQPFVVLMFNL